MQSRFPKLQVIRNATSAALIVAASICMLALVGAGAASANGAVVDDAGQFQGLIPGTPLTDAQLGDVWGRGAVSMASGASDQEQIDELLMDDSSDLRAALYATFRSIGIKGPMVPAAGTDTTPRIPAASVGGSPRLPRVSAPRLPRLPRLP